MEWKVSRFGGAGDDVEKFVRWVGKQKSAEARLGAQELSELEFRRGGFQQYLATNTKQETSASRDILLNAVVGACRAGFIGQGGASASLAALSSEKAGKDAGKAGKDDGDAKIQIETHGLVSFEKAGADDGDRAAPAGAAAAADESSAARPAKKAPKGGGKKKGKKGRGGGGGGTGASGHGGKASQRQVFCRIPSNAMQDPNQAKALVQRAFKFVELVKGTSVDFKAFTLLELELKAATLATRAAQVRVEALKPLRENFQEERNLASLLRARGEARVNKAISTLALPSEGFAAECGKTLASLGDSLGTTIAAVGGQGGSSYTKLICNPWKKLVDDTLDIQFILYTTQQRSEVLEREIQQLDFSFLSAHGKMASAPKQDREEYTARRMQLEGRKKAIGEDLDKNLDSKFMPLVQSWTLLLQAYYQFLLDKMYQKSKDLAATLEAVPTASDDPSKAAGEPSAADKAAIANHWRIQNESVTTFLREWQASFSKEANVSFVKACEHLNSIKLAFKEWVRKDLVHWLQVLHLKKLAGQLESEDGEAGFKVQIEEIDSDDSDDDDDDDDDDDFFDGEEDKEDGEIEGVFAAVNAQWEKVQGELEEKRADLGKTVASYDRARLRMHQLAVACVVDQLYFGKLADLFLESESDRVVRALELEEENKRKKQERRKEKKEKERKEKEAPTENGGGGGGGGGDNGAGEDEEEEEDEELEVEVHQENLFSALLDPHPKAKAKAAPGTRKGGPARDDGDAKDLGVLEKVRLQKEQERQRLEKKKEKEREKRRERQKKKREKKREDERLRAERERERRQEEERLQVERERAERQRILDREQARLEEEEERERITKQQEVIERERERFQEEERKRLARQQKKAQKAQRERERLQEEEKDRIAREQRKVQQEWEDKENSVMAACQKIYSTQLHRAQLAFQKLSQNPSREGVLRYALEDSKAELALVELEVARDVKTHGQEPTWREAQTQRLMAAQEKLRRAQQSLEESL